jgi:16S rRNA (guanine527-N7)-methyltransferase
MACRGCHDEQLEFESELNEVLPADLPRRDLIIVKCAAHLALIAEANTYMNLTRIVSPREAAIKHVLDSLLPWRLFARAKHVLDAGTGAGFPGIPLALVFPEIRFTLAESIQKKARFVESTVAALELPNVKVEARRVEELGKGIDIVTARAFAPLEKALDFIAPALKSGAAALLYKGPDAANEIATAARGLTKLKARAEVAMTYELPDAAGSRTIVNVVRDPNHRP